MKKLSITFPDKIAKRVERLPNPDEFVSRVVEEALTHEPIPPEQPKPGKSKWARLVEEIEENPLSLGDHAKQDQGDRADFRRSFRFKHDEP